VKAAVLSTLNRPLEVMSGLRWDALRRGQVLVKLAYSGVCRSQLMEARGRRGADPYLPHLLGHEGTGKVIEVGEGVTKVKPEDLVVLGWIKGHGLDGGSTHYRQGDRKLNAGSVTTFNEFAVVSENRLTPLPKGVPLDVGVLLGCAVPTGAGIITNDLRPVAGSSIAVFGLGGIGMSALMATRLFDCKLVIAVDVAAEKLAMARDFGATQTLDASQEDPVAAIRKLTGGSGVDYAVEASGRAQVIEQAFESIRRGGVCVFASHPAQGERVSLDPYELICGKQIRGSWGGNCVPDDDIPKFAALYRESKLPLEKLLTRRYTLDRINEALDDLEAGRVARPLIEIDTTLSVRQA
jgi:S-(hydroxymethyl)glutathione dehydrogenase/alcohol dehydrogenase